MITLEMQYNKTMALKSLLDMLHLEDSEPKPAFSLQKGEITSVQGVLKHIRTKLTLRLPQKTFNRELKRKCIQVPHESTPLQPVVHTISGETEVGGV